MGLDNIPVHYPCRREGTAVTNGEQIDCLATIDAGRCPWAREEAKRQIRGGQITGLFGTPCWYRGKAGNHMVNELCRADPDARALFETRGLHPDPFYGRDDQLSVEYLQLLAETLEATAESYARHVASAGGPVDTAVAAWAYAAWWCRFAAEHCGGSDTWY
jgi:hypothetical protein